MLLLHRPTLPDGNCPPGFIGYAVNLIYLDVHDLCIRTATGKGLRQTLFYKLFGETQVYETWESMRTARENSCIHKGAVSLDGWIKKSNGAIVKGCWEPSIYFPVISHQNRGQYASPKLMGLLQEEEETMSDLSKVTDELNAAIEGRKKAAERLGINIEK